MSIKFPDFQVLVSRSEQVPRVTKEGEQPGASGKMAPQVAKEFDERQKRIDESKAQDKVARRKEQEGGRSRQQKRDQEDQEEKKKRRRIDLRA